MSIAEDLKPKLDNNQHSVFITDADDLLAAWRHRRENTFKRSFDFSRVPQAYRLSVPPNDKAPLMPCHVTLRRKLSQVIKTIKPAPEYATSACHGHGRIKTISTRDLDALDAVSFAKRNIAPYVSPILDTGTLALVCKDLGISGRAIPKVIDGRQYIALISDAGQRTRFPRTVYAAKNTKIINMAIGALGIKNMVKNGGMITIGITVPLTVLECFLEDQRTLAAIAGNLAADLTKIGIGAVMGAIFGIAVGTATTVIFWPIATAIAVSVVTGFVLNALDDEYQLTEKLIAVLDQYTAELAKKKDELVETLGRTYHEAEKELIWRGYGFDVDNPNVKNSMF